MNIPSITLHSNSHSFKNLAVLVYVMMSAGMTAMMITIFLGAPVVVSMVALMGPMFLVVGFTSGRTQYMLGPEYLEKRIVTFFGARRIDKKYTWSAVKNFKEGEDMNRSLEQYKYIEVNFYGGETWQITDQKDKLTYPIFKQVFLQGVETYNSGNSLTDTKPAYSSPVSVTPSTPDKAVNTTSAPLHTVTKATGKTLPPLTKIERKKTFYETIWARVFFWAMALLTSAIAGFMVLNPGYMSGSIAFKVSFVIIPGMGYLYYRVYVKKT